MLDYNPIISYIVFMAPEVKALIITALGQLLVVAHHTDASPSLCYEPELISGLLSSVGCTVYLGYTLNGPGISEHWIQ